MWNIVGRGENPHPVVDLESIGGARLQGVTGRRHDLSLTVDSPNKRISMAEPGCGAANGWT